MDTILVCPLCKNKLKEDSGNSKFNCLYCDIVFEIRAGIPILIPKRLEHLEK